MQTGEASAQSNRKRTGKLDSIEAMSDLNKIFLRETVQGTSAGESKFIGQQASSRRQFAHVVVSVRPAERGRGAILGWNAGAQIPAHFTSAVLRGVQDALKAGAAGLEVTDVNVTVDAGSFHERDSSEEAFRAAAHEATLHAIQQAGPIILEAMSLVMVTLPANQVEVAELAVGRRGGEATPAVTTENGEKALAANVPAAAVDELFVELIRATGGNLTISSRANGYRQRIDPPEEGTRRMVGPRRS